MKFFKPLLFLWLFILMSQFGCTASVRPTFSPSEFLCNEDKNTTDVSLYVTDEFREYSFKQTDVMDLKEWKLELGPATTDALRFALESRFENVSLKLGKPQFPVNMHAGSIIVVPSFCSVKQTGPVLFKFEKYHVTITLNVVIYDPEGKELKQLTITGKGDKTGSIGYDSAGHAALPEATRLAVRHVADQIIQHILELVNQ